MATLATNDIQNPRRDRPGLPKAQAEALLLRAVVGLSVSEIAADAGCPEETIRSRLRLAKNALRSRIDGDVRLRESLEDEP